MSDTKIAFGTTLGRATTIAEIETLLLPDQPADAADQVLAEALRHCRQGTETSEDELLDALLAGPWELRSVETSGFRGAANGTGAPGAEAHPFRLSLPRSARVVVIQGANGTGKSTLADAVEVALRGSTEGSTAFISSALEQPQSRHTGTPGSDIVLSLENDHGDRLRIAWRSDGSSENAEVTWRPADHVGEEVTARPGDRWASAVSTQHAVVGYDHWTHRLRIGHLSEFVRDRLGLGDSWLTLWHLLHTRHLKSAQALDCWLQARETAATALETLDEQLALQYPYARVPQAVQLPAGPAEDVGTWFEENFPTAERTGVDEPHVDPYLESDVLEARRDAAAGLTAYHHAKREQTAESVTGEGLRALMDLVEHSPSHPGGNCPACGVTGSDWREYARLTLQSARRVREEFNLAQARVSELRDILVDRLLPLLRHAERVIPAISAAAKLRALVDPLVPLHPRSDDDPAWRALKTLVEDDRFAERLRTVLSELQSRTLLDDQWRAARRRRCEPFLAVDRTHGESAASVDATSQALVRLRAVYDRLHEQRRQVLADGTAVPLQELLGDIGIRRLVLNVEGSDNEGLDDAIGLELAVKEHVIRPGALSAGQYNALVLALLLGANVQTPLRFLVLDDPVHAMDDFRADKFAELIAARAASGTQVVLLTHDQQLVDVLRHHVASLHLIKLSKDPNGNIVQLDATHPWQSLVTDARKVLSANTDSAGRYTVLSAETAAVLVLSFCRQAVDAVVREFVVESSRNGIMSKTAVAALDRAFTTRNGLQLVERLLHRGHPAKVLTSRLLRERDLLNDLNAGSHGDPAAATTTTPQGLLARVDTTEQFCLELIGTLEG
ncbi:ATP-binding cassette domain-containing protein [Amycolatopsis eburnea]|uniref:ATP-binding cassette domain-containing protein n=1 Tax=Amycolatopsis eburnea TaxID=2267691 RepID=UPI0013158F3D|nr:ABC transporter ATP-binding protein [Amycolatopsis eburnea]